MSAPAWPSEADVWVASDAWAHEPEDPMRAALIAGAGPAIDALTKRIADMEAALLHAKICLLDARDGDCDAELEEDACSAGDDGSAIVNPQWLTLADQDEHPRPGFLHRRTGAWNGAAVDAERLP